MPACSAWYLPYSWCLPRTFCMGMPTQAEACFFKGQSPVLLPSLQPSSWFQLIWSYWPWPLSPWFWPTTLVFICDQQVKFSITPGWPLKHSRKEIVTSVIQKPPEPSTQFHVALPQMFRQFKFPCSMKSWPQVSWGRLLLVVRESLLCSHCEAVCTSPHLNIHFMPINYSPVLEIWSQRVQNSRKVDCISQLNSVGFESGNSRYH